ncbi:MAG: dihydropteroate synthase [Acidobacteria bacterium]|nr:dihydropteroate synthase [Acidobacteriota bacterium]
MGIVNVTPDSFSDGGEHFTPDAAVEHSLALLDDGADILDIGGESTRPGARVGIENPLISAEEELRRVLPVITAVKQARSPAVISIDTYKAAVARGAAEAGAEIVNDVSGLTWDPEMRKTVASLNCGVVIVHTRGRPDEWQSLARVPDLVMLVRRELRERVNHAAMAGVKPDHIVLDPGFGFGKRMEENFSLIRRFAEFQELGLPLAAGVSRKSLIGRALAKDGKDAGIGDRRFGTLGAEVALALAGAHVIRTHDVKASVEALRLADIASD